MEERGKEEKQEREERNDGSKQIGRENKQKEMVYWSQGGSDLLKTWFNQVTKDSPSPLSGKSAR